MKFGLWLLIGVVAFLWFNHAKRQRNNQRNQPNQRKQPSAKAGSDQSAAAAHPSATGEQVVACAHCGLHVPRSDAVIAADGVTVYCSPAHRQLHSPA